MLMTADRLPPRRSLQHSMRALRQCSSHLIPMMRSTAMHAAIISKSNVEVSTVCCQFDVHAMGTLLIKKRMLVADRRTAQSREQSAPMEAELLSWLPNGMG